MHPLLKFLAHDELDQEHDDFWHGAQIVDVELFHSGWIIWLKQNNKY